MEPILPVNNQPLPARPAVATKTATQTSTKTKVIVSVGILAIGAGIAAGLLPNLNKNMVLSSLDAKYRSSVVAQISDMQTRIDALQSQIAQCK